MSDDSEVNVKFGAETEGLEQGAEKAHEQIEKIKESLESLKESSESVKEIFEKAFEFAGIEIGLDAFKEWVKSSAELGEQMERTGAILGVTSSQASELAGMAKMTGTDFGSLEHAVERFDLGLAEATKAGSRMAEGLRVLGLSAKEFIGVPTAERLNVIAEAFSKFEDGPNKTAAAMALLGRAGAEMIPFLDKGREGMQELHDVLERTGAVMSNEMASSFAKTMEDINEMSLAWQGFSNKIFSMVNPAIDLAIREITMLIEHANPAALVAKTGDLAAAMVRMAADVAEFAIQAGAAWDGLIEKIKGSVSWITDAANDIDKALAKGREYISQMTGIKDLHPFEAGGPFGGLDQAGLKTQFVIQGIEDKAKAATDAIKQMFGPSLAPGLFGEYAGSGGSGEGGPGKPQVGQMQIGGGGKGGGNKDATATFSGDIQAAQDAEKAITDSLNNELKLHQITMSDWLKQTDNALDAESLAIINAYDKAMAAANLTTTQKIELANKEAHALAEVATQEADAQAKAAEASLKEWDTVTKEINGAFTGQIDGLLKGTENWSTALKNTLATLTEDLIKFFAEWGFKAVENQALQIASQNSITSGILSAMGLQAAGQAAASKPGIIAQIGADTGEAYAGFAAFLAPILGPAAPAAAAGLSAQVSSTALGLASFDVGSWELPNDQLAMVHAGEMIVPSRGGVADEFRSMALGKGGGDTHIHFAPNVSAVDARGVQAMLNDYGPQFARTVADHFSRNVSSRPKGY